RHHFGLQALENTHSTFTDQPFNALPPRKRPLLPREHVPPTSARRPSQDRVRRPDRNHHHHLPAAHERARTLASVQRLVGPKERLRPASAHPQQPHDHEHLPRLTERGGAP